jgi:hypothetical protein
MMLNVTNVRTTVSIAQANYAYNVKMNSLLTLTRKHVHKTAEMETLPIPKQVDVNNATKLAPHVLELHFPHAQPVQMVGSSQKELAVQHVTSNVKRVMEAATPNARLVSRIISLQKEPHV